MFQDRIKTLSCGCNYDTLTGACTAQCRYHRISEAVRLLNEVLREMDEEAGESAAEELDLPEYDDICDECGHPHLEGTPCPICHMDSDF
jgi:rubrerythrin